jgi:two-component system, NarL family, response regulator NreC
MTPLRLLIVDNHATVRDGLCLLFQPQEDIEVVGAVADGETAIAAAQTLKPDVIVLDLSIPGIGGVAVAASLRAQMPRVAIVVFTRFNEPTYVHELLGVGALGYVLKQSRFNELLTAVRAAGEGRTHIDCALEYARGVRTSVRTPARSPVTRRELEVLRLAAIGKSNKEVATALAITIKTVEVHKSSAMRKLRLNDRAEMLRFAGLKGWLHDL